MFTFLFCNLNENDVNDKFDFINKRIESFKHTMSVQHYANLLERFDLNIYADYTIYDHIVDLQ